MEREETVDNSGSEKRRKMMLSGETLKSSASLPFVQMKEIDCEIYISSVPDVGPSNPGASSASFRSKGVPATCCSSTGSPENLKIPDLEESDETDPAATGRYDSDGSKRFSTDNYSLTFSSVELDRPVISSCSGMAHSFSVPESEFKAQRPGELESTTGKQSPVVSNFRRRSILSVEKMPPEAEVEEFFAAAQDGLNKRFKDKYNYDILNDIPLKGRFEWFQVMPGN